MPETYVSAMSRFRDPEVQALLDQLDRINRNTGWATSVVTFTVLMGGVLVAVGRIMPAVPIAALVAIGAGVFLARENSKRRPIHAKIQSLMFDPK